MGMIYTVLSVIITFGLVIFIHELGHFLACKWQDIKVDAFSFGFGPELYGFTRGETRYKICAIPLGGYVQAAGEDLSNSSGNPREYFAKPWYRRLIVALSGPGMNYVLAFLLFSGAIYFTGEPVFSTQPVIGEVIESYPADISGLKPGDRVLSVNGKEMATWEQLATTIHTLPEQDIAVRYVRAGQESSITLKTKKDPSGSYGVIGISPENTYKPIPFLMSIKLGGYQCWYWSKETVTTLASKIYKREKPDVAGPVGIVHMVSKAAKTGFANQIFLLALISVAVGIFNLFPIPILDGGTSLLFIWEGISGRKLTEKLVGAVNSVGFVVLISIFLFATYSDFARLKATKAAKAAISAPAQQQAEPAAGISK